MKETIKMTLKKERRDPKILEKFNRDQPHWAYIKKHIKRLGKLQERLKIYGELQIRIIKAKENLDDTKFDFIDYEVASVTAFLLRRQYHLIEVQNNAEKLRYTPSIYFAKRCLTLAIDECIFQIEKEKQLLDYPQTYAKEEIKERIKKNK